MPRVADVEAQRARVIDAAWNVIIEEGFDAATMRRIASRARCTTGLVTHYFTSKEELLLAMVGRATGLAGERIARMRSSGEWHGIAGVRAVLIESTPIDQQVTNEWRIWIAVWDSALSNERMRAEWVRRAEGWKGIVREDLDEAISMGELAPDTPVSRVLEALAAFEYGLSISVVLSTERPSAAEIVRTIDNQLSMLTKAYGTSAMERIKNSA